MFGLYSPVRPASPPDDPPPLPATLDPLTQTLITLGVLLAIAAAAVFGYRQYRKSRRRRRAYRITATAALDEILRLRRQLRRQQLEADLAKSGKTPRLPIRFTAEVGEDEFLFELFEGRTSGRYIEAGAHDGVTNAVTYPFEAVGWTGLLVEPLPAEYEACRLARPGSTVVNAALGPPSAAGGDAKVTFTVVRGETRSGQHSFVGTDNARARRLQRRGKQVEQIQVTLTTLDALLKQHMIAQPGEIDFAVVDVEGFELGLIQGFSLEHWKPKVLMVEDWHDGYDKAVSDHVAARGYTRVGRFRHNTIYVRTELTELVERAREMTRPA